MSITPQNFHSQLNQLNKHEPVKKFLIAYSGGVDSHVLLHLCAQLKNAPGGSEQTYSAVYIDHGLSPHAKNWGQHCQQICDGLDIPLTIVEVDARPKKGQSPESAARLARYHALAEILQTSEYLLTGQHLNDQSETLLLQLLRGSGTRGLAAMPKLRRFSRGYLSRPMLNYRQQDILVYAKQHNLQWIEDETNFEQHFDRNYLRHSIFPLLQQRWPAVEENFARAAELQSETQVLLEQMAQQDMQDALVYNANNHCEAEKLLSHALVALRNRYQDDIRLKNLLRFWISVNHMPLPSRKILQEIINAVINASENANPRVCWNRDNLHVEIRKYRNILYLLTSLPETAEQSAENNLLTVQHSVELGGNRGKIILQPYSGDSSFAGDQNAAGNELTQGFDPQLLLSRPLSVAFRKGGESYQRTPQDITRTLKNWFQQQGIPPWERPSMPLIYWGDELIQVGQQVVNFSLLANNMENSLLIHWNTDK